MNLMFWKKKTANDAPAVPANEAGAATTGAFARIKARVAALPGRFRSPPPFRAEVPAVDGAEESAAEPSPETAPAAGAVARVESRLQTLFRRPAASPEGEAPPARRTGLIVAGLLLLLLLLGAFGYAAWTIVLSSPDPEAVAELIEGEHANDPPLPIVMPESAPVASDALAVSAPVGEDAVSAVPETHAEHSSEAEAKPVADAHASVTRPPLTEVEALRQKNAELQAELDALKKTQQSSAAVKLYPGGKGAPAGGVATVGSSDPKAAAATLKEAIEAMNTGSNYQQKPAK